MDVRPQRRWYQFTVGGLLILTTIVSLPLGWFAYERNKAWREQRAADEMQMLIRNTELAAQPPAVGKSWGDVQAQFTAAGYRPLPESDLANRRRFLVRENAWSASNGTHHDLIVDAQFYARYAGTPPRKDEKVTHIQAGLVGTPNISWEQAIEEQLYPPKSAVGLCLVHPEMREAAKEYPILKMVEVGYGEMQDHVGHFCPYFGFQVVVELEKSTGHNHAGKRLYFSVESHLDPEWDHYRQPLTQGFVPSSALGKVKFDEFELWETSTLPE